MTEVLQLSDKNQNQYCLPQTISHRARGFAAVENSREAILQALAEKAEAVEFDLRRTADGTIVVHHDARPGRGYPRRPLIRDCTIHELENLRHASGIGIARLETVIDDFKKSSAPTLLLPDIKEGGYEAEIVSMIENAGLGSRVCYVSWLPGVLFKICSISPNAIPVFSHYPIAGRLTYSLLRALYGNPGVRSAAARAASLIGSSFEPESASVYFNDYNSRKDVTIAFDPRVTDEAHFVHPAITGELLELLRQRSGWVCIPWRQCSLQLSNMYTTLGIGVSVYSAATLREVHQSITQKGAQSVLVDRAELTSRYT